MRQRVKDMGAQQRKAVMAKLGQSSLSDWSPITSPTNELEHLNTTIDEKRKDATMEALQVIEQGGTKAEADRLLQKREEELDILLVKRNELVKSSKFTRERDRLTHVLDLTRELEKEYNAPVLKSEIVERGIKEGLSEKEIEDSIDRLKMDGQIYDPNRNERYKIV